MEETKGDVIRINITPASSTFPFIQFFRHPYGIKQPAGPELGNCDAQRKKSRAQVASDIGEEVIKASKVLSEWFGDTSDGEKG